MLADSLEAGRHIDPSTPLPRPEAELSISRMSVAAPDGQTMIIRPFSLSLTGGEFICIAGANGAGKSSLLQTLAGVWPTAAGAVSLGGRSIHEWSSEDRGQYVGYVPQDVELLHGTIFENIARMQDAEPNMVYDAAKRAGAHDMILAMPNGYETKIGSEKGRRLSAGQRQLIGLARAFFNQPILLLLDEPSANLDLKSTQLMVEALQGAAANGDIVVAASHDRRLIAGSQTTLLVQNGSVVSMKSPEFLSASSQSENRLVSISGTRA
ncbi:MAG: ATP-binding cassette domain-containing protein [Pseudomonadota bacterium]